MADEDPWKDEDEDWPPPETDPEKLAHAHEEITRGNAELRAKVLRYVYFGLAVLVILLIVLWIIR